MIRSFFSLLSLSVTLSAATKTFQAFEGDGFDGWQQQGPAFGLAPVAGKSDGMENPFTGYSNDAFAASTAEGNAAKGTLTSPEFILAEPYITFLVAGGDEPGKTAVQLLIDGKVVRESVGKRSLRFESALWDVTEFKNRKARIRLLDGAEGDWGIIAADHIIFTDYPNQKFPAATREGKPFVEGLENSPTLAGVSVPLGSNLEIQATFAEHQITSPTAITFDEQGRIYVAETHRFRAGVEDDRDHLYWYLDDLAARTTADRTALHEKWQDKLPLKKLTEKSEIIRRLADTTGDGKVDESTVFADSFNQLLDGTAAGVFFYEGSLFFACIPKIYALRDTNGDGTADEREVVEDGFGVRISLSGHDLNGFTLGPDGRIYGTVGDRGFSLVTRDGVSYDYPNEGAAFRFEPDGSGFEIFHTGLRNPKEIAFDALGNALSVDNNSDQGDAARIVYLVEGGDSGWEMEHQAMHTFHRQIGLEERPPNRWMNEKMWEMENPSQPAFMLPPSAHLTSGPSGLTTHPGAGFLESEAGRFLICDYRGSAANSGIWSFEMKPKGAGMEMTDSRPFVWGIAATDVEYSWDGRVFISDFITGWKTHQAGRLVSLDAGESAWHAADAASAADIMKLGFDHRSSAELANLLKHRDARIRLRAQIALTRKPDAVTRFSAAADSSIFNARIHGIWGLGIVARRGSSLLPVAEVGAIPSVALRSEATAKLVPLLADKDDEIRAQALRALADAQREGQSLQLTALLADPSPRVRFFAAIVVGKHQMVSHFSAIRDMLVENNNRDRYLRHAGIYALQHMATTKPGILTSLAGDESAAVRLAATVALRRMKHLGIGDFLRDTDSQVADEAIRAIVDLDWQSQRPRVAALLDQLDRREWTPFMLRRLIHNAYRLGTVENIDRVLKVATDRSLPELVRKEAFRLLANWTEPFPADQLTGHWRPLEKRELETIRPALVAALPELLRQEDFVLTAALGLVGTYQIEVAGLDHQALSAIVRKPTLPNAARAAALELIIQRPPEDLAGFLMEIATDPSGEVALAALTGLSKLDPKIALPALTSAVNSPDYRLAQKAWSILGLIPGEQVDALIIKKIAELLAADGISPTAIELTAAAKRRSGKAVKQALAGFQKALATSNDPLARWNASLQGGDSAAGAALFTSHPTSQCMRCHAAEEGHTAGGETAPNLAGIAKRFPDRRYLLESLVAPGAVITPGYGAVLVALKNGASLTGNLMGEAPEHLDLDTEGKFLRVRRDDIESVTTPASAMPPMGDLLKPTELRDIVAWLATLDEGGASVPPAAEPVLYEMAAASPPAAVAAHGGIDPETLKIGRQQYMVCAACHGQSGEGTAAGPPLAGSEWVTGPEENLIRIQLRGLTGPITVKGVEYNFPAGMMPFAYQNDAQISAVLTHIRNTFGNSAPPVTAEAVAALRGEVGKALLTVADLLPPVPAASVEAVAAAGETPAVASPAGPGKYDQLQPGSALPKWLAIGGLLSLFAFLGPMLLKKK
ncbi:MAG: c-type cytochrome [Akkermansiaceae bacterium]